MQYLDGSRKQLQFTSHNQFCMIYLCDLFKLSELKNTILNYLSKNVDKNHVFEFLRLASLDPSNRESLREAYWIIVYIYLKKFMGEDTLDSFTSLKTRDLLKSINIWDFNFCLGFLESVSSGKKIDLQAFVPLAIEEAENRTKALQPNNMHNLNKVNRTRSDMGVFHDYPHYYELTKEGSSDVLVHGVRNTENGDFYLSNAKDTFCLYG